MIPVAKTHLSKTASQAAKSADGKADADGLARLCAIIERRFGLHFPVTRLQQMATRLRERMTAFGAESLADYCTYLTTRPEAELEWQALVDQLVINETHFLRHNGSFDVLRDVVLPKLMADPDRRSQKHLSFWSAGCSTGQEAYSLAMMFMDQVGARSWNLKVVGSDVCTKALDRARAGVFTKHEVNSIPAVMLDTYFEDSTAPAEAGLRARAWLREVMNFEYRNLADKLLVTASTYDVIFCQNVLIYFRPELRAEVIWRLGQCLKPGGYLFLGPAEAIGQDLQGLNRVKLHDASVFERLA